MSYPRRIHGLLCECEMCSAETVRVEFAFGRLPWWRRFGRWLMRKPEHDLGPVEWVDVTDRVVGEPSIEPGRPE